MYSRKPNASLGLVRLRSELLTRSGVHPRLWFAREQKPCFRSVLGAMGPTPAELGHFKLFPNHSGPPLPGLLKQNGTTHEKSWERDCIDTNSQLL